jgi:hypothetical protein
MIIFIFLFAWVVVSVAAVLAFVWTLLKWALMAWGVIWFAGVLWQKYGRQA